MQDKPVALVTGANQRLIDRKGPRGTRLHRAGRVAPRMPKESGGAGCSQLQSDYFARYRIGSQPPAVLTPLTEGMRDA